MFNRLNSLGNSLLLRFDRLGDLADLNHAIQVQQDAVSTTPDGHPDKPRQLNNLGNSLRTRFERLGDLADLNHAIQFHTRFQTTRDFKDLHAAVDLYSSAAQYPVGSTYTKFLAAHRWMMLAVGHFLPHAITAAAAVTKLIPQLSTAGCSLSDRYHRIMTAGSAAHDAAGTAIANEQHEAAVEWLEQGLCIVWSQLLQLRTPVDALYATHPDFASRFQLLSVQLEGVTSQNIMPAVDYHQLAHERDLLLTEIRQLPGFDQFLLPRTVDQLLPAADGGPVVMLNASSTRCDALIILPGASDVLHVPLANFSLEHASALRDLVQMAHSNAANGSPSQLQTLHRLGLSVRIDREEMIVYVLEELWKLVVYPILDGLAITRPIIASEVCRIWWCPTGPFAVLPIHAAGIYTKEGGPKLSDYVVSSYTPTLATLLRNSNNLPHKKRQLLTVALPNEARLPGTAREVKAVARHAKDMDVLSLLEAEATAERVAEAMKDSTWAHFACHGMQDKIDPTKSCLLLSGPSKLTISEIIKLSLENAELAFLAACETATGAQDLEDEAVHLAAGMLLAGYRSVIALTWSINDSFIADVADKTYELLFMQYGGDSTRSAEALHFAIKTVLEDMESLGKKVPFYHWVPFMHFGS